MRPAPRHTESRPRRGFALEQSDREGRELGRLGWYIDAVFHRPQHSEGTERLETISETFPFLLFACEVGRHADQLVLFGRTTSDDDVDGGWFRLPEPTACVQLPHYESLKKLRDVARATTGTVSAMWRGLGRVDTVAIFGPHPFALILAALAFARGRRIVLGVRQDTMAYFRSRLPRRRSMILLPPLWILDRCFHTLSRFVPTVVVGAHLERSFGGPRERLLQLRPSLIRTTDVLVAKHQPDLPPTARVDLVTVARIEPEKNPLLMVDCLAELNRRAPGRFHLTWIGTGKLAAALRQRSVELGVDAQLDLPGYVPFGPELLDLYRRAHIFVHVALTEAFGQVFIEAMASGTPIIGTAVGGVPSVLENGGAGWLVPPSDRDSLALAISRLASDRDARQRLAERGLEIALMSTLEVEAARFARFATA